MNLTFPETAGRTVRQIIVPEFPPEIGGVGGYTATIAQALRAAGDEVHVWCPSHAGSAAAEPFVHRTPGRMNVADLRFLSSEFDRFPAPGNILVQWVPHGYGCRSMNLPFCIWLWRRARKGDRIQVMIHEPFLAFGEGSWKQNAAAAVHRAMIWFLLRAAEKVWVSTAGWEKELRPYLPRGVPVECLPVVNNIRIANSFAAAGLRERYAAAGEWLIGHFGTHSPLVTQSLDAILPALAAGDPRIRFLLMGLSSCEYRDKIVREFPALASRLTATGAMPEWELSRHLQICDVTIQPYLDGISARRSSAMAALAHGLPLVTTCGKATEDLWLSSGAVSLAPVGDTSGFCAAVQQLLADSAFRVSRGLAARRLYSERFDVAHAAAKLRGAPAGRKA